MGVCDFHAGGSSSVADTQPATVVAVTCTVFSFMLATARLLEGTAQPTIHFLLTTMSTEALLTFSNLHNPSGVPRREKIPPSAKRMEANGGRLLKY